MFQENDDIDILLLACHRLYSKDKKTVTIFKTIPSLREWRQKLVREGRTLGFVPTMGGLHEGHLSLGKLRRKESQ